MFNIKIENEIGIITLKAVEAACNVKGGDWVFAESEVSCIVETGHGYDCIGDENILAIKQGCENLQAGFVCDQYYIGCVE